MINREDIKEGLKFRLPNNKIERKHQGTTDTFKTDMPTFTNGLLVTYSSFVKKTGRKQTIRCLESQTGRGSWKENLILT